MSRLKSMRLGLATFVVLLAANGSAQPSAAPSPSPTPAAAASPTPTPTPRARLLPYWYETEQQRNAGPMLHFEDQAEVRALEMNAAIARFFDSADDKGDMRRGATPGGAPTLDEMKGYRPHVSPSIDFLSLAFWAAKELKGGMGSRYKSRVRRNEELLRSLLLATASPTPSPTPSPSPSPGGVLKE